ncbi:hypothetical protein [Candidatus Coxiella mudrowiae]|uniref:hypothetical protein n=1 Tax=Candidatus Coxiella mudrowiae TaxID=2054173 RepID=UPI000C28CBAD|nr:hypothetical protein [Candidatus Coxiella mudrowiae]
MQGRLVGIIVVSILILILLLVLVFHALRTYFIKRATEEYVSRLVTYRLNDENNPRKLAAVMSVGSLAGINGVNVSSEVSGTIIGIDFESGKLVKRGQSLI